MTLWNYWISFGNAFTHCHERIDYERHPWCYTQEEARQLMERDISAIKANSHSSVYVEDSGVYPKDVTATIVFDGVIDIESDYESLDVLIGGKSIYEKLAKPFEGLHARLSFEILPT